MITPLLVTLTAVTAGLLGHANLRPCKHDQGFEACAKLTSSFGTR